MINFIDKTKRSKIYQSPFIEIGPVVLRTFMGRSVAKKNHPPLEARFVVLQAAEEPPASQIIEKSSQRIFILSEIERPMEGLSEFEDSFGKKIRFNKKEIIIGFSESRAVDIAKLCIRHGLFIKWIDWIGRFGLFRHEFDNIDDLYKQLEEDSRIIFAEPNVIDGEINNSISDLEADSSILFPLEPLWNHQLVGRFSGWSHQDGSGVIVAVVDTPIHWLHSGFKDKLLGAPYEFNFGSRDIQPNAHGTSICSIIVDSNEASLSVPIGLSPGAKILPISIDTDGTASYPRRAVAINFLAKCAREKSIRFADGSNLPMPRLIVNCSWQLQTSVDLTSMALAFKSLTDAGAICICSAGNSNSNLPHYPSDYPGCLSIAGVTKDRIKWTTQGLANTGSNYGKRIDFSLPSGDGKYPTVGPEDILVAQNVDTYGYITGTSFAAPHATAILANIWAKNKKMTALEVISIAKEQFSQSVDQFNPNYADQLGVGLLQFSPTN